MPVDNDAFKVAEADFNKTPFIAKWSVWTAHISDKWLRGVTAHLMENTSRLLQHNAETGMDGVLVELFGEDYREALLGALAVEIPLAASHHFVPWQPMSAPVGIARVFSRRFESPVEALATLAEPEPDAEGFLPRIPEMASGMIEEQVVANADCRRKLPLPEVIDKFTRLWNGSKEEAAREFVRLLVRELLVSNDRTILGALMVAREEPLGTIRFADPELTDIDLISTGLTIQRDTYRGPANVLVGAPEHIARIDLLNGFQAREAVGLISEAGSERIVEVGAYNRRARVFMDPLMPNNRMYYGYKGASVLDGGAVFCPYAFQFQCEDMPDGTKQLVLAFRTGWKLIYPTFYGRVATDL